MHVKFSFPVPLGQPHEIVPPQLFVRFPHALPRPFAGQTAGVQQTFGFACVLHVIPLGQPQVTVAPQPLSNVPHASPPVLGPFGTFAQV